MKHDLTSLDPNQIARYAYDEDNMAHRVVVTGDFGVSEAIKEGLKDIKIEPIELPQLEPVVVKVPEIVYVEKPVIVDRTVVREVEKPIVVREVEYREIEKPIIVRDTVHTHSVAEAEPETVQNKIDYYKIIELCLLAVISIALLMRK